MKEIMSRPILSLKDAILNFGGKPIFEGLSLSIVEGDKLCLVGRNGEGKSTLLKVLAGFVELDGGQLFRQPLVKIRYLTQDLKLPPGETAFSVVRSNCEHDFEAEALLDAIGIRGDALTETASGGEVRRILLAYSLVGDPEVLLLDEPTNHLDLKTIEWLEGYLKSFKGTIVVISHDRQFLKNVGKSVFWLDRGAIHRFDRNFSEFDLWQESFFHEEERRLEKLDSKLKLELHWLQRGVTARRKRNQGRLRKLKEMRSHKKDLISGLVKSLKIGSTSGETGSHQVIEAIQVSKQFPNSSLHLKPFSTRIMRHDRVGIVGPNGSGKTTLIKMLIGQLEPDSGVVKFGANIDTIYFDQRRTDMDPEETLWHYMCPNGGDQVLVQNSSRHVIGYLKDFLFQENQIVGKIGRLSGGEKNRLSLAKILTMPSNLMVLDEPTNDLDMETLDLLSDLLSEYQGTLMVISHDRDFLENLVTSIIAVDEKGHIEEWFGGYLDYLKYKSENTSKQKNIQTSRELVKVEKKIRLSYQQKKDWETLPQVIENLSQKIKEAESVLNEAELYSKDPKKFQRLSEELIAFRKELEEKENYWLELAELQEELTKSE